MNEKLIKSNNWEKLNKLACSYLEDGLVDEAYILFLENYQKNPCLITKNNLAYFYLCYGEKNEDGRRYDCPQKVIDLLMDIDSDTYIPYSILGHAFYLKNELKESLFWFDKAWMCGKTEHCKTNYAFLLYRNGEYLNAMNMFYEVYQENPQRIYMYYSYLFLKIKYLKDYSVKHEIYPLIKQTESFDISEFDLLDVANLMFLVEDYEGVISIYEKAFDTFFITPEDFHIIAYSLYRSGKEKDVAKYYTRIFNDYAEDYEQPLKEEIDRLNVVYKNYKNVPVVDLLIKLEKDCYLLW